MSIAPRHTESVITDSPDSLKIDLFTLLVLNNTQKRAFLFSATDTRGQGTRMTLSVAPSFPTLSTWAAAPKQMIRQTVTHSVPPANFNPFSCDPTYLLRLY